MQEQAVAASPRGASRRESGAIRRLVLAAVVAAVVVAVDQLTKAWAVHRLTHSDIHLVWKLDLELTYNSGASFGLGRGWAPVIGGVAVAIIVVLLSTVRRVRSDGLSIVLGLVIGGALGNLTDRVVGNHHGAVVDFIALHFWPAFNVADSCVVVGAMAAALIVLRRNPASEDAGTGRPEAGRS